jgi:thiosulfate/3-mercaptopyruvate sulfurtransferase
MRQWRSHDRSVTWCRAMALALVTTISLLELPPAWAGAAATQSAPSRVPWSTTDTVSPAALASELARASGADKPVVVCTGPAVLYKSGHVPGASLHGPANTEQGLNDLRSWAQGLSRSTRLVVYCGCCPLDYCPNLRPAYQALREMGFSRLRVLILPDNFGVDWANRGYAVEK